MEGSYAYHVRHYPFPFATFCVFFLQLSRWALVIIAQLSTPIADQFVMYSAKLLCLNSADKERRLLALVTRMYVRCEYADP